MAAIRTTEDQRDRFKRFCWPHLDAVVRMACFLSSRRDLADDLAQETMLKALRAIDTFDHGTDARAWLLTILRRTYIDHLRARRVRPNTVTIDEAQTWSDDSGPLESLIGRYDSEWDEPQRLLEQFEDEAVIDALQALPEAIRWTLLLVDVEQLEQKQAAAILNVSEGTIKSRAHRGRAMLRDALYDLASMRGWAEKAPDSQSCPCPKPVACVPACVPTQCAC